MVHPTAALRRAATQPLPVATSTAGHHAWGSAPDVERFVGRTPERATLRQWVLDDRCRVIGVLGMGGIGKTLLATRMARELEARFEHVYWRGLHNAPSFGDWLAGAIAVLSPHDPALSAGEAQRIDRLLVVVNESPSLFIIDNFETVLQTGERSSEYLPGCAGYGRLLKLLNETPHQSCILLTSREEPPELRPLKGSDGPVRVLSLSALAPEGVRELLRDKNLAGTSVAWTKLVEHYGGNGLALRIIGETIRELFGGNIVDFLTDVDGPHGGVVEGIRQLLESQIERLSELEQRVLRCLAVEREPVTFAELSDDMATVAARGAVRDATMALLRRSLLERRERGPTFLLQPVVLEYVTGQLTTRISDEIARGDPLELREQPLLKATARDHVRRSQERLILQPIIRQLTSRLGSARALKEQLGVLLDRLRCLSPGEQQYGPGNVVNLLPILRGDVRRIDLSALLCARPICRTSRRRTQAWPARIWWSPRCRKPSTTCVWHSVGTGFTWSPAHQPARCACGGHPIGRCSCRRVVTPVRSGGLDSVQTNACW
jgi:hypothetical protein